MWIEEKPHMRKMSLENTLEFATVAYYSRTDVVL